MTCAEALRLVRAAKKLDQAWKLVVSAQRHVRDARDLLADGDRNVIDPAAAALILARSACAEAGGGLAVRFKDERA